MSAGRSRTIRAACASFVAAAACVGATSAPAVADHPLLPDLVTLELTDSDLDLVNIGKRTVLRLDNEVGNVGAGPLEIFGQEVSSGCGFAPPQTQPFAAFQRTFLDANNNSTYEQSIDQGSQADQIGCLRYHDKPGHDHWHVLNFSRYSLVSEADGSEKDGRKAGFCLLDTTRLPESTAPQHYASVSCARHQPSPPPLMDILMGISPGWADLYGKNTPGQFVNVTGLETGRYCLRSEADPENQLTESDASNNDREVRVRLNPRKPRVKALSTPCQIPG